jgi:hypothetical protein
MDIKVTVRFEVSGPAEQNYAKPPNPFGEHTCQEPVDLRKAECPYCQSALKKIPMAKTKCPHCKQPMYVRTRPEDYARVVVRKDEAERIDAYWHVAHSAHEPDFRYLVNKQQVDEERQRLKQKFAGKGYGEPSDEDVKWALLTRISLEHAQGGEWGLYRNTRLRMADFLTRRMKLKNALRLYLEVCTLDLNGATKSQENPELRIEFPAFDLRLALATPLVLRQVGLIAGELKMSPEILKAFYLANNPAAGMKLPLSPQACWANLENVLNQLGKDE